jgi:hypothetical protein
VFSYKTNLTVTIAIFEKTGKTLFLASERAHRRDRRPRIAAILLVTALSASVAGAWPWRYRHVEKAGVRFLATSTLVRGTWGWNEDSYLAELHLAADNKMTLVRLVDAYPNEGPPLSRAVLTSDGGHCSLCAAMQNATCPLERYCCALRPVIRWL